MKKKRESKFGIINLIALCLLVLVLSFIPTLKLVAQGEGFVEENFVGKSSSLQGVLEVWNIDTFEAGTFSKESFLLDVAKEFQVQNKGTYVVVKNVSISEMNLELQSGRAPDVFSFGFGLGNVLSEYLAPINLNIKSKFASLQESGVKNAQTLAVGYMLGGYFLFSTEEHLIKANIEPSNVVLSQNINTAGYIKTLRKSEKQVYSMAYGENSFLTPLNALSGLVLQKENIIGLENDFEAYQNFVSSEIATILLGTQRSLARLENKVRLGQIGSFMCEELSPYCDLVQYFGISKSSSDIKKEYAQKFIDFATSEICQKKVWGIGMIPACGFGVENIENVNSYLLGLYAKYKEEIIVPKLFS